MSIRSGITLEDDDSVTAIVSLGSNQHSGLGTPLQCLLAAWAELRQVGLAGSRMSSLYETEPVDCAPGTAPFINAIALLVLPVGTSPLALLETLHAIESRFGRQRDGRVNAPRVLDLDLICLGQRQCHGPRLTLPHPRASQRRFVLQPLSELAPGLVLPGQTLTVGQILNKIKQKQLVRIVSDSA